MDRNVQAVIDKHTNRAEVGLKKYGVTTERGDLTIAQWLQHAQDEAMDLAIYLERLMWTNKELKGATEQADDFIHFQPERTLGDALSHEVREWGRGPG
jgi:hypothetical protein